jgi:hypothetical protein
MSVTNDKMIREYLSQLYNALSTIDYDEMEKKAKEIADNSLTISNAQNTKTIEDIKRLHDELKATFPDNPEIVKECIITFIKQNVSFSVMGTTLNGASQLILQRISQKYAQYVPEQP